MTGGAGWLNEQGRPARGRLVLTVALGEAAGILLVGQTAFLVRIVDGALFRHAAFSSLLPAFSAILLLICARAIATWASRRAGASCASIVKTGIRTTLLSRLREAGPLTLAGMRAGEIAHTTVDAVEAFEPYYARYLPQRAVASLFPFTILAVVFPLDWLSGLILLLTAVFLPLSMVVIGEEAHERNRRLWGTLARLSGRFLDVLQGLTTVRMFDAAGREARAIEAASEESRTLTLSVLRVAFLSSFMLELISAVSIAIVAVVCGLRLLAGSMSFFPAYFILLLAPEYFLTLRQLGTFYHSRMEAVSAAEKIRELLATPAAGGVASAGTERRAAGTGPARVVFRDVAFSYGERRILESVTLRVEPGEQVVLSGASGAGKSTLLALLLGFAVPQAGRVEIDGARLDSLDIRAWRERVGWLPQKPTLFHGTLRMNLTLGRAGATEAELDRAVQQSRVAEFLPRLPRGLDTPIGESGQGLSVGQAQRVALARLFLRDPGLVLLDEPTAHLDAESAALVSEGIRDLCAGRTTILVTHDPAGLGRVLSLQAGRLEEGA
jgi:ATP-binding cassette subfamily C protein CydD